MKKTIGFIPVRCGSKSIPMKNIKELNGYPLLYWCLNAAYKANIFDVIYVATECPEIVSCVEELGINDIEIFNRSKRNAQDDSSTESVILEFLAQKNITEESLFFLIQATNPFTQSNDFKMALEKYKSHNYDSLLTCTLSKNFYWSEYGEPSNYDYTNRPRRQDFRGTLVENGAFYINTVKNIKKYQNRLSGNIGTFIMDEISQTEIDEEKDWIIAEHLLKRIM